MGRLLGGLRADLRLALRTLRAAPGSTLAAVCCLALGLGANAAIFRVVDAIYFRAPAGVRDPAHLVRVTARRSPTPRGSGPPLFYIIGVSRAEFDQAASARPVVRAAAGYQTGAVPVGGGAAAEERQAHFVAPGYFSTLGVAPGRGRAFAPDEERGVGTPVVVLSHAYWTDAFGADPGVIGRTLRVYGRPVTVVGVAPRGFVGVDLGPPVDLWFPLAQAARIRGEPDDPGAVAGPSLQVIARVVDGTRPELAAAVLQNAFARAAVDGSDRLGPPELRATPLRLGDAERDEMSGRLARWLAAVSVLVLVVACTSVAGLALARGVARRRELAVRAALGAGRARVVRQLAAEGVVLTGAGALAAVAVWAAMSALLRRFAALPELPASGYGRVAAVGLAATLVVALACAVFPALVSTRAELRGALHDAAGGAAGASVSRARAREALLVGQLAVTLVLVVGAGLFLHSLANALGADLGFDVERTVLFLAGPRRSIGEGLSGDAAARLRERAAALPGVRAASFIAPAPFTGVGSREVDVPGAARARGAPLQTSTVQADEHFLEALGVRLVRGRGFTSSDRPSAHADVRAVLVNEAMARRDWPGLDPVGRCVRFRTDPQVPGSAFGGCVVVEGVVADVRALSFATAPQPTLYEPLGPEPRPYWSLVVRLRGPADARRVDGVRRAFAAAVPDVPLVARPLAELQDPELAPHRLGAVLFGVYGALALVLAAVGLHGVVRYNAERRARELAVRTALGASPADLVRLVAGGGARLAGVGALVGLAGALAGARLVAGLLYEVRPADPLAVAGACAALAGVTLLASWAPARRAGRTDPARALRTE